MWNVVPPKILVCVAVGFYFYGMLGKMAGINGLVLWGSAAIAGYLLGVYFRHNR